MTACARACSSCRRRSPDSTFEGRHTHMAIRSDEISEILKHRIESFEAPVVDAHEGVISSVGDGIARIYGLEQAMAGELLEFPGPDGGGSVLGLALDLREDGVGAVIMGRYEHLQEGDTVRTTG